MLPLVAATPLAAQDGAAEDARERLKRQGLVWALSYTAEGLGNPRGGVCRGGLYAGKLEGSVSIDFEKMAGWKGLSFFGNAVQIHNTSGMRDDHFRSLITLSNIEARRSTRLSEIWLEQKFADDKASLRFGRLAADAEFFIAEQSKLFISSDWPTILGANLPNGGPAFPSSANGVRLKIQPTDDAALLVALFNGDPGDPTRENRFGTNFRFNGPPLLMAEAQYRYDPAAPAGLGLLRVGGWRHFGAFDDQRFDAAGLSLANPLSSGLPRRLRGTSGVYGIVDHQAFRFAGGEPEHGVNLFARVSATPSDRNLVNVYADGGVVVSGLLQSRPSDKFGVSVLYARISDAARALDRDGVAFSGAPAPVRSYEMVVEATYLAQMTPAWTLQPVLQYVVNPAGGAPDPARPRQAVKGGAVIGLRSVVTY
jgi:porin